MRSPALAEGGASGIADVRTGHLRGQLEAPVHATHQAVVLARMRTLLFAHLTTDAGVVATRDRTRTGTAREQLGRVPNSSSTTGPWRRRRASATSRHWPRTSSTRACSGCGACPTCSTGTCRAATSLLPPVPAQRTTS